MDIHKRKIVGSFGESLARSFLQKRGYRIICCNSKLSYLEIDIVARKDKKYYFIEVKTKTSNSLGQADQALKSSQIKNLKRAIVIYCSKHKISLDHIQLDFVSVDLNKKNKKALIKHYKDIF